MHTNTRVINFFGTRNKPYFTTSLGQLLTEGQNGMK
jgi:hypothetical protein